MTDYSISRRVCDLLLEISSGTCSITEEMIKAEADPNLASILTGLAMLSDDLDYAAERRATAERELRKREARFRALFDQAKVAIWDCDLTVLSKRLQSFSHAELEAACPDLLRELFSQANVLAVNAETIARFEASSSEAFIAKLDQVVADESAPMLRALFRALARGACKLEEEGVLQTLSGHELQVIVGISTASDDLGQTIITVSDVTPLHRARRAAQELAKFREDELQRVDSEVERLFYAVSHDLRAPLRGVASLAEWAREDLGDDEQVRGHLEKLTKRILRLETMMNDLLSFARVGRVEHEVEDVDVRQLLDEIRDGLVDLPEGFEISWGNMPVISTEKTLLAQVFLNLISNAIKHHDKPRGRIVVSHRRLEEQHEFTVADDGPGIQENYREKVFAMFSTLQRRDAVEGSGMGLAFVHKLVTKRAGRITIADNEMGGASFIFTWAEGRSATSTAPAKRSSIPSRTKRRRT